MAHNRVHINNYASTLDGNITNIATTINVVDASALPIPWHVICPATRCGVCASATSVVNCINITNTMNNLMMMLAAKVVRREEVPISITHHQPSPNSTITNSQHILSQQSTNANKQIRM